MGSCAEIISHFAQNTASASQPLRPSHLPSINPSIEPHKMALLISQKWLIRLARQIPGPHSVCANPDQCVPRPDGDT
jgi:hypothetical protein